MDLHKLLPLDRPMISLDFETTGIHPKVDRIVQIGVCKVYPAGEYHEWESLVNPTIPIPAEATETHGITDVMVREAPTFRELSLKLVRAMEGCDLCGYNVANYDGPIIVAEFERCGIKWALPRILDAFRIYQRFKPRNLTDAVDTYLSEKLEGAHGALNDSRAALRVLAAQLERHPELPRDVQAIHDMFFVTPRDAKSLDPDAKLIWKEGKAIFNFGKKHLGKSLQEVSALDPGFLRWMLSGDFSPVVKTLVDNALKGQFPSQS